MSESLVSLSCSTSAGSALVVVIGDEEAGSVWCCVGDGLDVLTEKIKTGRKRHHTAQVVLFGRLGGTVLLMLLRVWLLMVSWHTVWLLVLLALQLLLLCPYDWVQSSNRQIWLLLLLSGVMLLRIVTLIVLIAAHNVHTLACCLLLEPVFVSEGVRCWWTSSIACVDCCLLWQGGKWRVVLLLTDRLVRMQTFWWLRE